MILKQIDTFYPLSPGQQGMLFHTLLSPQSGVYVEQIACTFEGKLDVERFLQAWNVVIKRHPILRTCFVWQGLNEPIQVVLKEVPLSYQKLDWRHLSKEEQEVAYEAWLKEDRVKGFQMDRAPLMRLTLIQMEDERTEFIWTHHHILLDGWSLARVLKEVLDLYLKGQIPLSPGRPFRDYIVWLTKQSKQKAEQFWREELKGIEAPTSLKNLQTKGSEREEDYKEYRVFLSLEASEKLQQTARKERLTLNTLVQGAWAILLSRYSGEKDVLFGTAVSGRPPELTGVEEMIGLFLNTLPLRTSVDPKEKLSQFFAKLQNRQVRMREFEYSSLVEVQRVSDIPSHLPFFESILVFENYPITSLHGEGIQIKNPRSAGWTNFPLTLLIVPDQPLVIRMKYDSTIFDEAWIKQVAEHLLTLLEKIPDSIDQPIQQLKMEDFLAIDDQKQNVLIDTPYEPFGLDEVNQTLKERFEKIAARYKDHTAVLTDHISWTYQELNKAANRVAHAIIQNQKVGNKVGLLFQHDATMLLGILGAVKAGKTYVPLDPKFPESRLLYMIEDAEISLLITHGENRQLAERLVQDKNIPVLDVDQISDENNTNPEIDYSPDDLAYILYTSGSTGIPKGVMQSHRNVLFHIRNYTNQLHICSEDRMTLLSSYSFDASVMSIYGALLNGATLVPIDLKREGLDRLKEKMRDKKITIYHSTPTVYRYFLSSLKEEEVFPDVRVVVMGGEEVQLQDFEGFKKHFLPPATFVNGLGPTECTVAIQYQMNHETKLPAGIVPIGAPVEGTEVWLLDDEGRQTEILGEIAIVSKAVALGYWKRPDLTEQSFIKNSSGQVIYKTGDLGRLLPGGIIEFLGRKDTQVKIRGFRIETGEIETRLRKIPEIREVAVVAQEDEQKEKHLVAYLVADEWGPIQEETCILQLKKELPDYMIPSFFVKMDELPLTPTGKVNRRALPKPEWKKKSVQHFVPPQTELERKLASIWEEVLKMDRVGVEDNFFDLGGHSLLMIQVHSKLQASLEREIPMVQLFQYPTIRALANYLENQYTAHSFEQVRERVKKQRVAQKARAKARARSRRS